jgi:glutathione S-transferase
MWLLYQFPLCPFSRKLRLLMGEKGIGYKLVRENPWEKRDEFIDLNPCGQTPVLVNDKAGDILIHSQAICEYIEETSENAPLIHGNAPQRAEIRRLCAWFDEQFFQLVGYPLLYERMIRRIALHDTPDAGIVREAMRNASQLLEYIDWQLERQNWVAGSALSLADLTAAAHISVADYLGGINWNAHPLTKQYYSGLKSRPSFRPLLGERMEGLNPPEHYDQVDF